MTNEYDIVTNTQPYAEDLGVATENNEPASHEGQGVSVTRNVIPMASVPELTDEQKLELAACFAEYCGVDPDDRDEWRTEMVGAKKYIREIMSFWRKRRERERKALQREARKANS
jgi:hypothetical protein